MMMGKTAPIKMMKPAEKAVSPNQMIANGIQASGGIGRRSLDERVEERIDPAVPAHGDPDRDADKEGHAKTDGKMDQARLEIGKEDVPSCTRLINAARTSVGAGRMNGYLMMKAAMNCQTTSARTMATSTEPPVLCHSSDILSHGAHLLLIMHGRGSDTGTSCCWYH